MGETVTPNPTAAFPPPRSVTSLVNATCIYAATELNTGKAFLLDEPDSRARGIFLRRLFLTSPRALRLAHRSPLGLDSRVHSGLGVPWANAGTVHVGLDVKETYKP